MHEFKHGELESGGSGRKVKSPKRAIAIALSEAGASNRQSPRKNEDRRRKTKEKERKGETAEARKEGKRAQDRTMNGATSAKVGGKSAKSPGVSSASAYAKRQDDRGQRGNSRSGSERRGRPAGRTPRSKSKSELYEQAKQRGIPGRSRMSKSELARALAR
jgi:hypothetical protein